MYTFLAGSVYAVLVNNTQPSKFTDITVAKYNLIINLGELDTATLTPSNSFSSLGTSRIESKI